MSGLHQIQLKSVERQRKSLEAGSGAGSFNGRLRRDLPSVSQEEFPNSSICDEGFLYRSQTQDASRALWRNLRTSAWLFVGQFFKQKYYTHNVHIMQHFKMLLSTGHGCPLQPSVTLKLKQGGVEVGQVQVVPGTAPVETRKIFKIGIGVTDMFIYKKNSIIILQ